MNARERKRLIDAIETYLPLEFREPIIRALRLLAAAEGGEGTPAAWIEHHKGGDNLVWDKSRHDCTPLYTGAAFAKVKDERNGLAARVAELEKDEARLRFLADEPLFDQLGEIDLHEEAAINSSALGRDEPNSNDYLAAIRTAIDAARGTK